MKITRRQLRKVIQEQVTKWSWNGPSELQEYGLEPGMRAVLTKDINWINRGGIQNTPEQRTAWLLAGTEVEVGRVGDNGYKIEVYDLGRDQLFTVRTRELIEATE